MRISWRGQVQQCLQQSLEVRRRKKIAAARDQAHALKCVVHDDRKVIRSRSVLTREHDIAEQQRINVNGSMLALRSQTLFLERQRTDKLFSFPDVEAKRIRRGGPLALFALVNR